MVLTRITAVDETVVQLNAERHWLYTAVDSDTERLLYSSRI